MAISSFGKILTVLDLFSVSRPVINVDIICEELGLSKPTSYRYLKELVSADLLKRINGTSGDYTLGSKIAVLDYVSRTTDPLVQISTPFMRNIVERTELCCLLTYLNDDYCIDIHHEIFKDTELLSYGRGCPRPIYVGASPKTMVSHLSKQRMHDYYQRFSQGEIDPNVSGLAVPVRFSSKEVPLALTLVASKNRFDFLNIEKLIEILQENAALIEQRFMELSEKGEI